MLQSEMLHPSANSMRLKSKQLILFRAIISPICPCMHLIQWLPITAPETTSAPPKMTLDILKLEIFYLDSGFKAKVKF